MMKMPKEAVKKILVSVVIIVSLILLIIAVTYSWFLTPEYNFVTPYDVQVKDVPSLQIRYGTQKWEDHLFHTISGKNMDSLCSDGISFFKPNFYEKELYQGEGYTVKGYDHSFPTSLTKLTAGTDAYNKNIAALTFGLKSSMSGKISISPASYFGRENDNEDISGVFGALRLALYRKVNGVDKLLCIWFPNASYEYNAELDRLETDGNIEEYYYLYSSENFQDPDTIMRINTQNVGYYYNDIDDVYYIWDLNSCPVLFNMTKNKIETMTIKAWIEGTDRECNNVMTGTNPDLFLEFSIDFD